MRIGILYVNMSLDKPCGSRNVTVNLAKELALLGHSVFLICNTGNNPKIRGVKIIEVDTPKFGSFMNCIKDPFAFNEMIYTYTQTLLQVCIKEKIEIINAQHCLYSTIIANNVKLLTRIPFVATCHGSETFESHEDSRMEKMMKITNNASAIIAVSHFLKNTIKKEFTCPIKVVHPGVDSNIFKPLKTRSKINNKYNFNVDSKILLFAGRLIPEKGILELISIFPNIKTQIPNIKLIIAGTGKLEEEIRMRIDKNSLGADIVLTGPLSQNELAAYYSAADLTVMPSMWQEPFGLVATESLACNTPIIATASAGIKEAIIPIDANLLFSKGNLTQLKNKIIINLKKSKIKNYRKLVLNQYNWKKMTIETLNIYKSILKTSKN